MKTFLAAAAAALIAAAALVSAPASAGALAGPQSNPVGTKVYGHKTHVYNITFEGGELARVRIVGDHDTDLDLIVRDSDGDIVCRSEGPTDVESCRFTPYSTGRYRIEVRNLDGVYNEYTLRTN